MSLKSLVSNIKSFFLNVFIIVSLNQPLIPHKISCIDWTVHSMLMEKYRKGQKKLHCVVIDLEKVYDRVPREELWFCMRKSGVTENVRLVQEMYNSGEV